MGIDISIGWLTIIMFGSLITLLMAGLPLAFVTGGLACVFLFILGDAQALNIVPSRIFPLMTNYQLSAIPLFIFMAAMLVGLIGSSDVSFSICRLKTWCSVQLAAPLAAQRAARRCRGRENTLQACPALLLCSRRGAPAGGCRCRAPRG